MAKHTIGDQVSVSRIELLSFIESPDFRSKKAPALTDSVLELRLTLRADLLFFSVSLGTAEGSL